MLPLLVALLALQSAPPAAALAPVPLPGHRHGHRVEAIGGGLLCFGGFGDPSAPDREAAQTFWLAPGATAWQRRADMGRPRAFAGSATVRGVAYALGGGVERYDPAGDRWIEVVPAGTLPETHFGTAVVGETVFVLGGYGGKEPVLHVVDVAAGKVRAEPPPPGFRQGDHFHLVHALGGALHVIGGLDGERFKPRSEHWVRTPGGWERKRDTPIPLWAKFTAHAVAGGSLHAWGEDGAWRYDPSADTWSELPPMGVVLAMPAAVAVDGQVWVLGGQAVGSPEARFLRRFELSAGRWSTRDGELAR